MNKRAGIRFIKSLMFVVILGIILGAELSSLHIQTSKLPIKFGNQVLLKATPNPAIQLWCSKIDYQPRDQYTGWPFVSAGIVDDTACSRLGSFSYEYLYPMGIVANIFVGIGMAAVLRKIWLGLVRLSVGGYSKNEKYIDRDNLIAALTICVTLGCLIWASVVMPGETPPKRSYTYRYPFPALINIPGETSQRLRTDTPLSAEDCSGASFNSEVKLYYGFPVVTKTRVVTGDNPCSTIEYTETAYPIGIWINAMAIIVLFIRGYYMTKPAVLADMEISAEKRRNV